LKRATLRPASSSCPITSSLLHLGPIVHTTLVLRGRLVLSSTSAMLMAVVRSDSVLVTSLLGT
jgi:hypothetical protein